MTWKRARDIVAELFIGTVLVTAFVVYLFVLPKGSSLNWRFIALVLNTAVVFGFLISWFRDFLPSTAFWAGIALLLLAHFALYLFFLSRVENWPLSYYVVLNPVELALFVPILRRFTGRDSK